MTLYVCDDTGKVVKTYELWAPVTIPIVSSQLQWCHDTFKWGTWEYAYRRGVIYFEYEKDKLLFLLKWAS